MFGKRSARSPRATASVDLSPGSTPLRGTSGGSEGRRQAGQHGVDGSGRGVGVIWRRRRARSQQRIHVQPSVFAALATPNPTLASSEARSPLPRPHPPSPVLEQREEQLEVGGAEGAVHRH